MPRKSTTSTSITSTKIYNIIQRRMYRRRKAGLISREEQKEFYKNLATVYAEELATAPRGTTILWNSPHTDLYNLFVWSQHAPAFWYWHRMAVLLFPPSNRKDKPCQ